jgi:hypothetical protein
MNNASSVYGGLVVPMARKENSMTYESAAAKLTGRCAAQRKIGNNTLLIRKDESTIVVKLHATEIITFKSDGRVIFNTGGWKTITTKARINEIASGFSISQADGVWTIYADRSCSAYFADGITWVPGKGWENEGPAPKDVKSLVKRIKTFTEKFMVAFDAGEVPAPSGGDCWFCYLKDAKTGEPIREAHHIESHIEDSYFVPSLLANAIKRFPVSKAALWYVSDKWAGTTNGDFARGIGYEQLKKSLYRYMKEQMGVAA